MYFPIGWPKVLQKCTFGNQAIKQIVSNRDKILFAALTDDSLVIWFCKPCVPIVYHRRNEDSLNKLGVNVGVEWKPDSSMICIATAEGHLILYNVEVIPDQTSAYQQSDPPSASLRRDSAELFVKEIIPPLKLILFKEVMVWDGEITRLSCISGTEIMVCTTKAHLLRYRWDGTQNRDYCLDLGRIPFCINQQVSKAIPIVEDNTHVSDIEYSPLVGGFGITLNDGRAAFLTSSTLKFDPNRDYKCWSEAVRVIGSSGVLGCEQVQGIWAQGIDDATCASLNHKYRLIAIGRKNSQVSVFTIDETTGGLESSHSMVLSSKDFPGDPGAVRCMRWTGDGRAVAISWDGGGISVWSTFGALLMCSLAWDYGLNQDLANHNPLNIYSMEWCTEGYQLWMVRKEEESSTSLIQLDFIKSAMTVNPCMNYQSHLYLQADDRLYVNLGDSITKPFPYQPQESLDGFQNECEEPPTDIQYSSACDQPENGIVDGKQWVVLPLPATYSATNWPIRYSAIDAAGQNLAVAGRTGIAHYNMASRRWKLFGNETQEKDFVVTGGMLWWRDYIVVGCFSILNGNDELRFYPRESKLDNKFSKIVRLQAQVLLIDMLDDQLVVFGSDALVTIYELIYNDNVGDIELRCLQAVEVSALCVHPACVVSAALCRLQHEPPRPPPRAPPLRRAPLATEIVDEQPHSLVLNVSGRLMMVQREETEVDIDNNPAYNCLPATVLASCVEGVWAARRQTAAQAQLTRALWLWCGAHGARVWLPLFGRHTFMAKRIMLPFHLKIYPLAILFEDAILLGVENDTTLYTSDSNSAFSLPFCVVNRTSQVYLHQILRQLLRRNLGYHAFEIARSCSNLPYFPHSLELLLHEVLEEEATSKEPIPDAQLPSVIEFIQEFPVYLQTVVQCARKTEIALWAYLFSAAGKPKELFQECLVRKMLDTAASYLIILQNLESSAVSRQLATVLLDTALQRERWDLARDLVRFLRAIDPNDVDSPRNSMNVQTKFSQLSQTTPVSPNEEDLSVILGSMQVNRGRSFSTTVTPRGALELGGKVSTGDAHQTPSSTPAPTGQNLATATVKRKKSVPTARSDKEACGGTAEEFFIDVMIQRHARRLLTGGKLAALGAFAARLDLHLVAWLGTERERAARVDNAVGCLKKVHQDFAWPYPLLQVQSAEYYLQRKTSTSLAPNSPVNLGEQDSLCGDSGYVSLPLRMAALPINGPLPSPGGCAVSVADAGSVAEGGSVWGEGEETGGSEERRYAALMERLSHQQAEQGAPRAHVQLRYFLQIMTEAGCLEWSLVIAVVLRDAMAVLRTTNAARSNDISLDAVKRLKKCLQDLCTWTDNECLGYKPFMLAICNQVPFLTSILNSRERRQSMMRPRTSSTSTSRSNSVQELKTITKNVVENNLQIVQQNIQEKSKLTEHKDSPKPDRRQTLANDYNQNYESLQPETESTGCVIA